MDCAYLKSSDTNISDYFDSSKSYCIFLNNRVKVPLKSVFSSEIAPYKKRMSLRAHSTLLSLFPMTFESTCKSGINMINIDLRLALCPSIGC